MQYPWKCTRFPSDILLETKMCDIILQHQYTSVLFQTMHCILLFNGGNLTKEAYHQNVTCAVRGDPPDVPALNSAEPPTTKWHH